MVFKFKEQLNWGIEKEKQFLEVCHITDLELADTRKYDFTNKAGLKVELKSDSYPMDKTPNFFIEVFSVYERGRLGGPYQSLMHGANTFVYCYWKSNTYFWFPDLLALCQRLHEMKLELTMVKNVGYSGAGAKIRREELQDLYEEYTWS